MEMSKKHIQAPHPEEVVLLFEGYEEEAEEWYARGLEALEQRMFQGATLAELIPLTNELMHVEHLTQCISEVLEAAKATAKELGIRV